MPTKRKDQTGKVYGALQVVCLAPDKDREWLVRWNCCGKGEILDSMRVAHFSRKVQAGCKACLKAGKPIALVDWTPPPPRPKRPDTRDRSHAGEIAREHARNQQGIHLPGRGFWPFMFGPMGAMNGIRRASQHYK